MSIAPPAFSHPHRHIRMLLILLGAGIGTAGILAVIESFLRGGTTWVRVEILTPSFFAFLVPSLMAFSVLALSNYFWLNGPERASARRAAWTGLAARLLCLMIIPVGISLFGYASDNERQGILSADALNAVQTAWRDASPGIPITDAWVRSAGDNTGGITVIGVIAYRIFSSDVGRPLLLGLIAVIFSSLTVAATYRFGELVFPRRVAVIAAWIVALYPEAVLIGSSHLQLGYLAFLLGILFFAMAAFFQRASPPGDVVNLPSRSLCLVLSILAVAGIYFISNQFFQLTLVIIPITLVWFSNPSTTMGRWIWIAGTVLLSAGLLLFVLANLNLVSSRFDLITAEGKYLYGAAWTEYDKAALHNGQDVFQNAIASLPRSDAFLVAGFYGILQPVLPAAIGVRNLTQSGGTFWQALGIYRGLGWYPLLLLVFYASLCAFEGIRRRHPETIMALFFWMIVYIGSYRALGDQWDNPRYRLFALIPMALLAAWGWVRFRQRNDPWLYRLLGPFATGVIGLTVWYILRYSFDIKLPPIPSLMVLTALGLSVFFIMLFIAFLGKKRPSG